MISSGYKFKATIDNLSPIAVLVSVCVSIVFLWISLGFIYEQYQLKVLPAAISRLVVSISGTCAVAISGMGIIGICALIWRDYEGNKVVSIGFILVLLSTAGCFLYLNSVPPVSAWDGLTFYFDDASALLTDLQSSETADTYKFRHRRHGMLGVQVAAVGTELLGVNGTYSPAVIWCVPLSILFQVLFIVGYYKGLGAFSSAFLSSLVVLTPLVVAHTVLPGYQEVWIMMHLTVTVLAQLIVLHMIEEERPSSYLLAFSSTIILFIPALALKNLAWVYGLALSAAMVVFSLRLFSPRLMWVAICSVISGFMVAGFLGFDFSFTTHPSSRVAIVWSDPPMVSFGGRDEKLVFSSVRQVADNFWHAFFKNTSFSIFVIFIVIACVDYFSTRPRYRNRITGYLLLLLFFLGAPLVMIQFIERFAMHYGAPGHDLGLSRFLIPWFSVAGMFLISNFVDNFRNAQLVAEREN